jgi:hypothetical protein
VKFVRAKGLKKLEAYISLMTLSFPIKTGRKTITIPKIKR